MGFFWGGCFISIKFLLFFSKYVLSSGKGDDTLLSQLFICTSQPQPAPSPRQKTHPLCGTRASHHLATHQSCGLQVFTHSQTHQLGTLHPSQLQHRPTQGLHQQPTNPATSQATWEAAHTAIPHSLRKRTKINFQYYTWQQYTQGQHSLTDFISALDLKTANTNSCKSKTGQGLHWYLLSLWSLSDLDVHSWFA